MHTAVIRAMATALLDHDCDPLDQTACAVRLLLAGWPARQIEEHLAGAQMMAMIRRNNEIRRKTNVARG